MDNFDAFLKAIKLGTKDLARDSLDGFQEQAGDDANAFLDKSKDDLKRWTKLLAQKEINEEDFSDLVNAKKALAEMFSLRQSGLALIKIEKFRKSFINLVVDTAFDVFL